MAVRYTYGNSNWRDLLTAWNGNAISSDAIGNMRSDGTRTYTWRNGRELATVTKGGVTWTNTYNADGIRTKRTNGTNTYSYIYNGGSLSQMTVDGTVMNFAYDYFAAGRALAESGRLDNTILPISYWANQTENMILNGGP